MLNSELKWLDLMRSGGLTMIPLMICSLIVWVIIFERLWRYRKLKTQLHSFHLEVLNLIWASQWEALKRLCEKRERLPTAQLLSVALERSQSQDAFLRDSWWNAVERQRHWVHLELKQYLWVLGTIGSAAPFIGLFGTVVGILRSFQAMAQSGSGGFAIVAAGISESLIATAAGIVVAVIAVLAFNAFQTYISQLMIMVEIHTQEWAELLETMLKKKINANSEVSRDV